MRWPLARRLFALPLTVLVVTVLAFAALSASGSADPSLAHLPRFLNTRLLDARARADAAVDTLARRDDDEAAATLARLGGAALPTVLPRLDGLAPAPRTRVALALAPVATRMGLGPEHQDPLRASAAWQLWWVEHAPDWKPAAIRRVVRRYVTHPSPARLGDVRALDTAALVDVVAELGRTPRPEVEDGLVAAFEHALALDGDGDLAARAARLRTIWRAHSLELVTLDGVARPIAAVLETRYGKWATRALVGDLGSARDGRAVLSIVLPAARVTLSLVGAGALLGVGASLLGAILVAVWPRARSAALGALLGASTVAVVLATSALGSPFARGAAVIVVVVVAATSPAILARLNGTLSSPAYVTARAFGAGPFRVAFAALRVGAIPLALASLGSTLPAAFTAAFVVEKVSALPGLGRVAADAVAERDVTVLMAIAVLASLAGVVSLAIADLAQLAGDPRIEDGP